MLARRTFGAWRSLVALSAGGRAVAGSNPAASTSHQLFSSSPAVVTALRNASLRLDSDKSSVEALDTGECHRRRRRSLDRRTETEDAFSC